MKASTAERTEVVFACFAPISTVRRALPAPESAKIFTLSNGIRVAVTENYAPVSGLGVRSVDCVFDFVRMIVLRVADIWVRATIAGVR